jgi:hypothetical protein
MECHLRASPERQSELRSIPFSLDGRRGFSPLTEATARYGHPTGFDAPEKSS